MTAVSCVREKMERKGVTIYRLSKITGLRYELLRRTLHGKRKFPVDEFIKIMMALDSVTYEAQTKEELENDQREDARLV